MLCFPIIGCQLREDFAVVFISHLQRASHSPPQQFQTQPTDKQILALRWMVRVSIQESWKCSLCRGRVPSGLQTVKEIQVCSIIFLGGKKESDLSACVFVSVPVTNAVGCFDFASGQDVFCSHLTKSYHLDLGGRESVSQGVYSNVPRVNQGHPTLTSAAALLGRARGWPSSRPLLPAAHGPLQTFLVNSTGNSLAAFAVTFGESTCWYGVTICNEMKTMTSL